MFVWRQCAMKSDAPLETFARPYDHANANIVSHSAVHRWAMRPFVSAKIGRALKPESTPARKDEEDFRIISDRWTCRGA